MRSAQVRLDEIRGAFIRRWKVIVFPFILVTGICVVAAFMLPRKYESSTTIFVRPDQTLNQITGFDLMNAFEEQLRNSNQIINSRSFLRALADSLGAAKSVHTEIGMQTLLSQISSAIQTTRLGSDSFKIAFVDSDPARAKRAAEVIATMFVQAKIAIENKQNALTVQFYEKKVEEYREGFEATTQSLVSVMRQNVDQLPAETRSLYSRMDEIEKNISSLNMTIQSYQDALITLRTLPDLLKNSPEILRTEDGKQPLLALQRGDFPFASDLRTILAKYDDASRRYTDKYPEVLQLQQAIQNVLERMLNAIESERYKSLDQRSTLERRRAEIIEELKRANVSTRINQDKESNYDVNQKLYNEMKLKLENARLAEEVGSRGASQFVILDPAILPSFPTKPNRTMIVMGGAAFGLLLGIIAAIISELLDTTIRSIHQVEIYQKPVIALLPDARRQRIR